MHNSQNVNGQAHSPNCGLILFESKGIIVILEISKVQTKISEANEARLVYFCVFLCWNSRSLNLRPYNELARSIK